jgi:hypothetical protein
MNGKISKSLASPFPLSSINGHIMFRKESKYELMMILIYFSFFTNKKNFNEVYILSNEHSILFNKISGKGGVSNYDLGVPKNLGLILLS